MGLIPRSLLQGNIRKQGLCIQGEEAEDNQKLPAYGTAVFEHTQKKISVFGGSFFCIEAETSRFVF